jgi:hypothetical protein
MMAKCQSPKDDKNTYKSGTKSRPGLQPAAISQGTVTINKQKLFFREPLAGRHETRWGKAQRAPDARTAQLALAPFRRPKAVP